MIITLSRELKVESALLHGRVSFYRRIPYIIPMLIRAREGGGSTPQAMSEHLCVGSDVICMHILEECEKEGLVERDGHAYNITPAGDDAISENQVPATIRNTFLVHYAPDPLLDAKHKVLLICDGGSEAGDRRARTRGPEDPDIFGGSRIKTLFGEKHVIRIVEADSMAVLESSASGRITWSLSKTKSEVVVRLDGQTSRIDPPSTKFEYIWNELLGRLSMEDDWDTKNDRLLVCYWTLDDGERRTMKTKLHVRADSIDAFGAYDEFDVEVDIYPADQDSAQRWAQDLLAQSVANYVTMQEFDNLKRTVAARFPEYVVEFESRESYADNIGFKWHIRAMEDWGF